MSFGAVVALVATYESWRSQAIRPDGPGKGRLVGRVALYLLATVVTTVVAGSASGVIALYHFNRVAYYGLVANLVAVPLTGFWIMPWAVIACALMPFGLDAFALAPMGWGVERSEEHTSELQSLMRISYAVFCLKKKN